MTRAKISEYSATANDNTDVNGINIAEGCPPSSMNNMGREIMAALKRFQVGSDGDGVTVGGNLVVSGSTTANTFSATQITASGPVITSAGTAAAPAIVPTGDTNTGVFFPAADTIAFAEGGAEAMRINSSGNVGIGTSSPTVKLRVANTGTAGTTADNLDVTFSSTNRNASVNIIAKNTESSSVYFGDGDSGTVGRITYEHTNNYMRFDTNAAERMRITSGGDLLVAKTVSDFGTVGIAYGAGGSLNLTRNAGTVLAVNRLSSDGNLVDFYQDSALEGNISVSGNTVSYNAFTGGHWSQLQQGRGYNPDIPRGTVMSTIGEMAEWKSMVWDEVIEHPAVSAVEAKEAVLDEEGNIIEPAVEAVEGKDAWTETFNKRESYLGDLPVGATFEEDGFTKTVVDDGNERLPKVKISDVVGDKAVYGVFQTWDEAQDMLVTSLGAFVVRIAAGVTVEIGDLLESNGDGCAKVQDDDVIRSKTIAKVTSTTPTATYDDGSYTVPAVIYCG